MRTVVFASVGLVFSLVTPLYAVPPPEADPKFGNSIQAMAELKPFLGNWTGILPGKHGFRLIRSLRLLGDVILFESGYEKVDEVAIIGYNLDTHSYRLLMPGYRNTFRVQPDSVARLARTDASTIQWVAHDTLLSPSSLGPDIRHTVSVLKGKWHEKLEWMYEDGRTETFAEMDLTKSVDLPN